MFVKSTGPIVFSDSSDDEESADEQDDEMDLLPNDEKQSESTHDRKRLKMS